MARGLTVTTRARISNNPGDPRHGTLNGYRNLFCRCERCRRANAAYQQRADARRSANPVPEYIHGTVNGYSNYGCRCGACTAANTERTLDYYHRKSSAAARGSTWGKVCKSGHPLEGEHLYVRKDGRKMCRTCNLRRTKQWKLAQREAVA